MTIIICKLTQSSSRDKNIYWIAFPYLFINTSNCILNFTLPQMQKKILHFQPKPWTGGRVMVMPSYSQMTDA